jgi:hypothetical protein
MREGAGAADGRQAAGRGSRAGERNAAAARVGAHRDLACRIVQAVVEHGHAAALGTQFEAMLALWCTLPVQKKLREAKVA